MEKGEKLTKLTRWNFLNLRAPTGAIECFKSLNEPSIIRPRLTACFPTERPVTYTSKFEKINLLAKWNRLTTQRDTNNTISTYRLTASESSYFSTNTASVRQISYKVIKSTQAQSAKRREHCCDCSLVRAPRLWNPHPRDLYYKISSRSEERWSLLACTAKTTHRRRMTSDGCKMSLVTTTVDWVVPCRDTNLLHLRWYEK